MGEVFFWQVDDVIRIHDSIIDMYGGSYGLVNGIGGLESALSRPAKYLHYQSYSIPGMAAVYIYAIADGHVFTDGNKRTSVKIAEIFLIRNGYYLLMDNFQLEQLVLKVADTKSPDKISLEYLAEQFEIFSEPFDASSE